MDVTKIVLTKVKDFCQLASHKCGIFSDLRFHSTRGPMDFLPTVERGMDGVSFFLPLFKFKCKLFAQNIQNKQKSSPT